MASRKSIQNSRKSYVQRHSKIVCAKTASPFLSKAERKMYLLSSPATFASVTVLEEAADQLAILAYIGDLPEVETDLTYKTLESRFGSLKITDTHLFDPETIEPYEAALNKEKHVKFQKDRSYVENILRATINNLLQGNSYEVLVRYLNQYKKQVQEEDELLENESMNRNKLMQMKNLLEKERRDSLTTIQNLSENIGILKDRLEDLIFENKVKINYIGTWENSRIEQNTIALNIQEEHYMNIINKNKTATEREIRIDAEIEAFIREIRKEHEEQIQMWMERYDKELELREMSITKLRDIRAAQFTELEQMTKLYDDHKSQIEEYLQFKETRRKEAEFLAKQHQAATKLQAWWRGTMVRKGFGPFMKKKGKKGKEGKGSDKKKGKK